MAKPVFFALVQNGSTGPDVGLVQKWLNGVRDSCTGYATLTVDGKFGSKTEAAVREFQTKNGLTSDGKVGVNTWNALYDRYATIHGDGEQYPGVLIRRGTTGATIRSAQARLTVKGFPLNPDGNFGANTESAVRSFQRTRGLSVDGIIGPNTWAALYA